MGRADLRRGETIPFRIEPEAGKVLENDVQPVPSDRCDVLSEDSDGAAFLDDAGVLEPEAASVAFDDSSALAGLADVLAGKTADDPKVVDAAELEAVQFANVAAENRRWLQCLVFHPRQEAGRSVGFPLNVTHAAGNDAEGFTAKAESEVEPAMAGEEGQIVDGNSHTSHSPETAPLLKLPRPRSSVSAFTLGVKVSYSGLTRPKWAATASTSRQS